MPGPSSAVLIVRAMMAPALLACALLACVDEGNPAPRADTLAVAAGTPGTLAAGTTVQASIQQPISSGTNRLGDRVKAIVRLNVLGPGGRIVIPGGSAIVLTIARIRPATGAADGVIALDVTSLTVGTITYAATATIDAVPHSLLPSGSPPDRDVVVMPGTPITITLTRPLAIAAI